MFRAIYAVGYCFRIGLWNCLSIRIYLTNRFRSIGTIGYCSQDRFVELSIDTLCFPNMFRKVPIDTYIFYRCVAEIFVQESIVLVLRIGIRVCRTIPTSLTSTLRQMVPRLMFLG